MIDQAKRMLRATKTSWLITCAMMGFSAAMFVANLCTSHWTAAGAWFTAGMAWCVVELKERTLISLHGLCKNQQELIVIQHRALVKGGIIPEKAPEEEAGAAQ
jgi:hypothetical protein